MRYLPYNKNLKQLAHNLRNHSTLGEILLWNKLKCRKRMGFQFYRQKPLDNFIVDFYCPALKLIIEVDGEYHSSEENAAFDNFREKKLREWKLNFLGFKETQVRNDMINVIRTFENYIFEFQEKHSEVLTRNKRESNPPGPFRKGGMGCFF